MADRVLTMPPSSGYDLGPERKWSCTRGHVWYSRSKLIGVMIEPPPEVGAEPGDYCWKCLAELLREHVGRVKEG